MVELLHQKKGKHPFAVSTLLLHTIQENSLKMTYTVACFLSALLILLFVAPLTTLSQDGPPPIPDPVKKFYPCTGEFKGNGTMMAGGTAMNVTVHHKNSKISDGYGLQFGESIRGTGMPEYKALNIPGMMTARKCTICIP